LGSKRLAGFRGVPTFDHQPAGPLRPKARRIPKLQKKRHPLAGHRGGPGGPRRAPPAEATRAEPPDHFSPISAFQTRRRRPSSPSIPPRRGRMVATVDGRKPPGSEKRYSRVAGTSFVKRPACRYFCRDSERSDFDPIRRRGGRRRGGRRGRVDQTAGGGRFFRVRRANVPVPGRKVDRPEPGGSYSSERFAQGWSRSRNPHRSARQSFSSYGTFVAKGEIGCLIIGPRVRVRPRRRAAQARRAHCAAIIRPFTRQILRLLTNANKHRQRRESPDWRPPDQRTRRFDGKPSGRTGNSSPAGRNRAADSRPGLGPFG